MSAALVRLVKHHKAGLMLDTNVLLLFLADAANPDFVWRWRQTDSFTEMHVEVLRAATAAAPRLVTTPHVLTEATNLVGIGPARDRDWQRVKELLRSYAQRTEERHFLSRNVAADDVFSRLGLADLAQAFHRRRSRPLVLTDDAPLTRELEQRNLPVANLTNYAYPANAYGDAAHPAR